MRAAGRTCSLTRVFRGSSPGPPVWSFHHAELGLPALRAEPGALHVPDSAAVPAPQSPLSQIRGLSAVDCAPRAHLSPFPGACGAARALSTPSQGQPRASRPGRGVPQTSNSLSDLDWHFLRASFRDLPEVLLELLLPDSPSGRYGQGDPKRRRMGGWFGREWYARTANVESAYRSVNLRGVKLTPGRLVRGIVYEMSALMVPMGGEARGDGQGAALEDAGGADVSAGLSAAEAEKLRSADLARRDWQGFLMGVGRGGASADSKDKAQASKDVTRGITVDEIADQLGMPAVLHDKLKQKREWKKEPARSRDATQAAGLLNSGRVTPPSAASRKDRHLEELLAGGRGDGIRSKYMGRINEKKMLAEASIARGVRPGDAAQGGWVAKAKTPAGSRPWLLTPGGAGILRYLKERLLQQALLVTKSSSDLIDLTDDIAGFEFSPTLQNEAHAFGIQDLYRICEEWNVAPKEVLVVLGSGPHADSLYRQLQGSAFYTCHLRASGELCRQEIAIETARPAPAQHSTEAVTTTGEANQRDGSGAHAQDNDRGDGGQTQDSAQRNSPLEKEPSVLGTVMQWFRELEDPAAHVATSPRQGVHFALRDMFDLKNAVEDLNGVSYRSSTFVKAKVH